MISNSWGLAAIKQRIPLEATRQSVFFADPIFNVATRVGSELNRQQTFLSKQMEYVRVTVQAWQVYKHRNLRLAYIAQQHMFHLAEFMNSTPYVYIQRRYQNGYDEAGAVTACRAIAPSCDPGPQALQRRLMEPPNEEIRASRLHCACVLKFIRRCGAGHNSRVLGRAATMKSYQMFQISKIIQSFLIYIYIIYINIFRTFFLVHTRMYMYIYIYTIYTHDYI